MTGLSKFCRNFLKFLAHNANSAFVAANDFPRNFLSRIVEKKAATFFASLTHAIMPFSTKSAIDEIEEEFIHNMAIAGAALTDGDFVKAEVILMKTLKDCRTPMYCLGLTHIYDMLATIAVKKHQYDKAETLLTQAIEMLLEQGTLEEDHLVVSFGLKLARIYCAKGEDELAEVGFQNCLKTQRKKFESKNINEEEANQLLATILYWYGKFLLTRRRLQEAKTNLEECLELTPKIKLRPTQIMVILYNLGEVCFLLGMEKEALNHYLKAIFVNSGMRNPDLPFYYAKVCLMYMHLGSFNEAKLWCDSGALSAERYKNREAEIELAEYSKKLETMSFA